MNAQLVTEGQWGQFSIEIIILVWIACPFFSAIIAREKGIGEFTGFFAGVLLGPLGVLIVLLMPNRDK